MTDYEQTPEPLQPLGKMGKEVLSYDMEYVELVETVTNARIFINAIIGTLNAAIDRINEQDKALDFLDTQNLLLNERIAALEAKYEEHWHEVYRPGNLDSLGNTTPPKAGTPKNGGQP